MELAREIRQFCERTGVPPTRFGRMAVNDPRLLGDLERGRRPGPRIAARARSLMAGYRA